VTLPLFVCHLHPRFNNYIQPASSSSASLGRVHQLIWSDPAGSSMPITSSSGSLRCGFH
jgi:hypothetical protein